ncbi:MAG TPA: hypothetical protein VGM50_20610 [Gemmatimonadaceae bacterium]|jgi:hypothetical protein
MRSTRLRLSSTTILFGAFFVARAIGAQSLAPRITDKELWELNTQFSESAGYFRSDNFLSNETGFQYVIPELLKRIQPGGVYLGVGPEQNFTYIVALQPKIAFIFDIRRGNMIAHLMYKALLETSADRADFLSKLFSRPRPAGLDTNSTPKQLFDAYTAATPDSVVFRKNLAAIKEYLTKAHGFVMADSDSKLFDFTYGAFFGGGPQINYNYPYGGRGFGRGGMPNYATLQNATDSTGKNWAYLATEANFRWLKDFESKNLLVPVVGNFAGPKAIRAVGQYLKDHHAVVSAFYTSNVEQYLWQQGDDAPNYYRNVATLPLDSTSTFIRSIGGGFRGRAMPLNPNIYSAQARLGGRLPSVTSSMLDLVKAFNEGRLNSYADVINMSR